MEMKLPKSLIVGIWVVGIGLVLNGVQPFVGTPANAQYGVQKVAICDVDGDWCADILEGYAYPHYKGINTFNE
jgi:hypothetical protein